MNVLCQVIAFHETISCTFLLEVERRVQHEDACVVGHECTKRQHVIIPKDTHSFSYHTI